MGRPKRILIVDDEEGIRSLVKDIVEAQGHEAEVACDGLEALAKLNLDIDLVLLDLMMPGMDGYEVARRIRQRYDAHDMPIIMLTALTTSEDRLRAVEIGANDFIAKPADVIEIRTRMASLLKMKEAHDALKRHQQELEQTIERRTDALRKSLAEMVEAERRTYEANKDTIYRLALAAEYKDIGTGQHIRRISEYAGLLAKFLNLPPHDVELARLASPLHDVGKIGIPERILLKPGPLTDEERAEMQQHTLIGSHLLDGSSSDILMVAKSIALTHHERWDGTGYPNHLAGDAIPIMGRICAVADVFDALTSERPYKPAWSNDDSLHVLKEGQGTQFDPGLIDLFIRNFKEVEHIQQRTFETGPKGLPLVSGFGATPSYESGH